MSTFWMVILIVVMLSLVAPPLLKFVKHKSLYPFMPFKYNFRRRRKTFRKVLQLLSEREAKTLIETGTSRAGLSNTRGDGAGTFVFGKWAKEKDAFLYSVDIDEEAVAKCSAEVVMQGLDEVVEVICEDSLQFLARFERPIDFLYLDSYDYSRRDREIQRKSQEHHLEEFKRVEHLMHDDTIVLIDDCGLPGGGKGKLLIDYMTTNDWKIRMNDYQVLLLKAV